jgi:hypothetical protein
MNFPVCRSGTVAFQKSFDHVSEFLRHEKIHIIFIPSFQLVPFSLEISSYYFRSVVDKTP